MKTKVILVVLSLLMVGGAVGMYVYYDNVLRFQDDYTDCPVTAFRTAVTAPAQAAAFATEASYGSLSKTEKCSLDCKHGNPMACAVYGLALQEGIFVMQDRNDARNAYKRACDRGENIGCALATQVDQLVEEEQRKKAEAETKKKNAGKIAKVEEARQGAALRKKQALAHFNGVGPMLTEAMVKWQADNVKFLLYEKPMLSKMHQIPGPASKDLDFKAFVSSKYVNGTSGLKLDEMLEFFDKYRRLGVMQIRLDHYVEKKKESEIPKKHDYFRGKHTFLYHTAEVELGILETVKKRLETPAS